MKNDKFRWLDEAVKLVNLPHAEYKLLVKLTYLIDQEYEYFIELKNHQAASLVGMSKGALYDARKRLEQKGLIRLSKTHSKATGKLLYWRYTLVLEEYLKLEVS